MTEFDTNILVDIWKWKLLTTAALTRLHFSGLADSYGHRRLLDLKMTGFIEWVHIPKEKSALSFAWTLTKKGFEAIRDELGDLRQDGFKSEALQHDIIVSAVHLGNWLSGTPQKCAVFTEQELRRHYLDHYPDWVPKTEIHRPDGYWLTRVGEENAVGALEVERSQKSPTQYRKIAGFYANREGLFRVVWVVRYEGLARRIQEAVSEVKGPGETLHTFIREKDFRALGWEAPFFLGRDIGKPLSRLLPSPFATTSLHVGPMLLLDMRKSPHRSSGSTLNSKSTISHRLGSSLVSSQSSSLPSTQTKTGDPTNDQ